MEMVEPMDVDSTEEAPELWRNRDVATNLFHRGSLSSNHGEDSSGQDMPMAASFDVDTCLARLRRDKAAVVRDAFGAAAHTVLLALEKDENPPKDATNKSSTKTSFVPPLVQQWQQLQDARTNSMIKIRNANAKAKKTTKSATAAKGPSSRAASPKPTPAAKPTAFMPTSAATSDSRLIVSRAVLCTAASITFDQLTPVFDGHDLDVIQVPQNNEKNTSSQGSMPPTVNMGAVKLQAQTLGDRVATLTASSTRRSRQRYDFRRDNARYAKSPRSVLQLSNPFSLKGKENALQNEMETESHMAFPPNPILKGAGVTTKWKSLVLPRFKAVLETGCGHAVYCDVEWQTRHGRIANLLHELSDKDNYMGPHLIVTTTPHVQAFAQEFKSIDSRVKLVSNPSSDAFGLTVLTYAGSKARRQKLREHFPSAAGLRDSSFHVMVMSYADFLEDYLHICQLPYQAVILDEGWSLLAAAHMDSDACSIGALWEHGMFSTAGQHTGLAGTMQKFWDFSIDNPSREQVKTACTGLTARHRILTTRSVDTGYLQSRHQGPVRGLVKFLIPHFPDEVQAEWDRCKIETDGKSMEHMRQLTARSIVVYHPDAQHDDLYKLALDGMDGKLPSTDHRQEPDVPVVISDETFIDDNKVFHSRRAALACFGQIESRAWLRYELGSASFKVIEDAIRRSGAHGYICEEIVTASSLTSSGATGAICGTMAYRLAVRCGRSFGSDLGLRQHVAAMHAPSGTWLCRSCGIDCGTSPSRTAHERGCGVPPPGADEPGGVKGGDNPPTERGPGTFKKQTGFPSVVGKKKKNAISAATSAGPEDKDSDGSFRVPGYRGVWVNPAGKHFVKIGGERLKKDDTNDVLFFDSTDDAAMKYDELIRERGLEKSDGLNFNEDGTRIVHEDNNPAAAAAGRGLEIMGGDASSVVPALSVINIKDLPKDVTPLLRDPRQTSRTGGNSKRHVYAYRGVCRQARKGHDRWQSQISFSGTNHYLGTFDSEWDAAAIYAWAHLILYGEEATRKARLEGEEAAAAYEQEKKDIAAGKVVAPPPKAQKKKRKKNEKKADDEGADEKAPKQPKKKRAPNQNKSTPGPVAETNPLLAKAVISVPILAPRQEFESMGDSEMIRAASARMEAARNVRNRTVEAQRPQQVPLLLRPCVAMASVLDWTPPGGAMLMGLSPLLFGWNTEAFLSSQHFQTPQASQKALVALNNEYGINRFNDSFRTILQGTVCVVGRANERTERAWDRLGFGTPVPLGATVGELDCNIGGLMGSCSEAAATIAFCPSSDSAFQFRANNDRDTVTLNGRRIRASTGSFPLFNEDVMTVGARVFVFLLPAGK